jgi:signal transduction histidine kinase
VSVVNLSLARALRDYLKHRSRVLLLETRDDFVLTRKLGEAKHYGLGRVEAGASLRDKLCFLNGLTPDRAIELAFVELRPGVVVDVHIVPQGERTWIVFFDVLEAYERERRLQQRTHETQLLNQKLKAMVDELRQTQAALKQSHASLERANQGKARLIAGYSHELKTPLTAILGFASHLKPRALDDPLLSRGIAAVERGGAHLLTLIDNLLDASVLELDQFRPTMSDVDVGAEIGAVCALLEPLALERRLSLAAHIAPELPAALTLDAARLRQILINLIGNAIKFTEHGHVTVSARWTAGALCVRVSDTGPGVSAALRARLFEPFARAPAPTASGSGLGLSISRALAKALGGELALSDTAPGAEFALTLPAPIGVGEAERSSRRASRAAHTVLVLDDDLDVRTLLDLVLRDAGYRSVPHAGLEQLLDQVAVLKPSLLLLDLNLGGHTALDALAALRAAGQTLPVLLISADPRLSPELEAFGVRSVLSKPIQFDRLLRAVDAACEGAS